MIMILKIKGKKKKQREKRKDEKGEWERKARKKETMIARTVFYAFIPSIKMRSLFKSI